MEPAITFYGDQRGTAAIRGGLSSTEVTPLPGSGLPSVSLTVNGITIPALLDTGSPITVLNAAAARVAAIQTVESFSDAAANPLTRFAAGMKKAKAAASGDVLTIGGASGPVQLYRAQAGAAVSLGAVEFGDDCQPYVGELPGLAAVEVLGTGPAAVLGTDLLRRRPRLIYTSNRVFL